MFHFVHQRVSTNRTDLEQLKVKLQSILSIIRKYRENDGLSALDYRVENFSRYVGSSFCPFPVVWRSRILRAIDLQIDKIEKLYDKSLWTRTLEGTKDADAVLKVFRNISRLCDVFQVSFWHNRQVCLYIDLLAKIDTQLNTEVKVEEIFKVFPPKHE